MWITGHVVTKTGEKVYVQGEWGTDLCFVTTEERSLPILGWTAMEVLDTLAKAKKDGQI